MMNYSNKKNNRNLILEKEELEEFEQVHKNMKIV